MAEHKHGEMDTSEQEKVFAGFIRFSIWTAAISIGILIFLAIFNS
ncbi:MAG: aa3-type cytochrome c oxidase subunit IV [Rhodobacteraceae bacterium]|nr:aa3-type cytochrome c oxidase subunit IV [Paracoccaceae bacterium]